MTELEKTKEKVLLELELTTTLRKLLTQYYNERGDLHKIHCRLYMEGSTGITTNFTGAVEFEVNYLNNDMEIKEVELKGVNRNYNISI